MNYDMLGLRDVPKNRIFYDDDSLKRTIENYFNHLRYRTVYDFFRVPGDGERILASDIDSIARCMNLDPDPEGYYYHLYQRLKDIIIDYSNSIRNSFHFDLQTSPYDSQIKEMSEELFRYITSYECRMYIEGQIDVPPVRDRPDTTVF